MSDEDKKRMASLIMGHPVVITTKDIIIGVLLTFLVVDTVAGWFSKEPAPDHGVVTFSMDDVMQETQAYFRSKGQSKERSALNSAYFLDYVSNQMKVIDTVTGGAVIIERGSVYGSTSPDISKLVFEAALIEAKEDMDDKFNIQGRRAER